MTPARFVAAALIALIAACGDDAERHARAKPAATAGAAPPPTDVSTTAAPSASGPVEGVVIDRGQNLDGRYQTWWVVDLTGGATIDGATRLLVDVPDDELGCGDDHRPISSFQITDGDPVSFQLTAARPGDPPAEFMAGTDVSSAVAVAARQFRIACPPNADDVDATVAAQRARWAAAGIESYEFLMTWMQFNDLAGDYRITVIDGQPRRVVRSDSVELDADRLAGRLPTTIDEVFDALADGVTADSFTASYDPTHGYPVEVHIDQITEGIDDELDIRITAFTLDPAAPNDRGNGAEIGQLVEATPIDWSTQPANGQWHWLLAEASDGTVIHGSSRLAVGIRPGELTCGEEHRPIDTLETLQAPP